MNFFKASLFISRFTKICRIQGEPTYTDKGSLEFVINRLHNVNSSVRIYMQVTDTPRDSGAVRDFVIKYHSEPLVDLHAYVEFHPEVYINDRGAQLLHKALVDCALVKVNEEKPIQGIRINPNASYEFFDIDIEDTAVQLR